MLVAQRWILARLRNETFFALGAMNAAIRILLDELNDRPMKKLGVSRRVLFGCTTSLLDGLRRPSRLVAPRSPRSGR